MSKKIIRRTPRQAFDAWLVRLRSGKHKQAQRQLKKDSGSMCCLGVLCEQARVDGGKQWASDHSSYVLHGGDVIRGSYGSPPQKMTSYLGLRPSDVQSLMILNDEKKQSFAQIADWLEARKEKFLSRPTPRKYGD